MIYLEILYKIRNEMIRKEKKATVLLFCLIVIVVLTILCSIILSQSISENNMARRNLEFIQAFWLAEAGVSSALVSLKNPNNWTVGNYSFNSSPFNFSTHTGGYNVNVSFIDARNWTVTSTGFIPHTNPSVNRTIEVRARIYQTVPANFYTNSIYSAGGIDIAGNSYEVIGNVTSAYNISGNTNNINGSILINSSINPLQRLNFGYLKSISINQGNYRDKNNLTGPFPSSFWYNETAKIPNIVFLDGDFKLRGNEKVGGFFVVVGEVDVDLDVSYNATLGGNVEVIGAIYTLGNFTLHGGGNRLNVNGGIWSGRSTRLTGNSKLAYNSTYMNAIANLNATTDVQTVSWKELYPKR